MKKEKNKIVVILVIILLAVVLVGGYYLCSKKLSKASGGDNGNDVNDREQNNDFSAGDDGEVTVSKSGEVLEFALGRLVVDSTGEVYYMTGDDTNLGSEKVYTTTVYETQPNSYEFMGYKLNVVNIKALYVMQLGNGQSDYYVFLIDKSGNVSVIKFNAQDGTVNVGNETKLTQYKDIVTIVPTSSFEGHSALAIDKDGKLYELVTSAEATAKDVTNDRGEVLEFTFGKIIIDTNGEVYYEPATSAKISGNAASLSNATRLGNRDKYTTKSYQTGPDSFEFTGYKLKYTNIKSAYAAYLGNGAEAEYVFLLDNTGNMHMIKFEISNDSYDVVLEKKLVRYKDIVSVVKTSGWSGNHALAVDRNGILYDLLGE